MKKLFTTLTLLLFVAVTYSQTVRPAKKTDHLVGKKTKADLQQEPFNSWYTKNYDSYNLDEDTANDIKKHIADVNVKIFMGTWCGDSKRETPRFYKLLENAGFDESKVELITVNRSKSTPEKFEEGLNIIKVPTFIFYKNGEEIGRFVEYPRETLEKDVLKIVSGQPYKHSYDNN